MNHPSRLLLAVQSQMPCFRSQLPHSKRQAYQVQRSQVLLRQELLRLDSSTSKQAITREEHPLGDAARLRYVHMQRRTWLSCPHMSPSSNPAAQPQLRRSR